jgi:hypothetical protein
MPKRLPADVRTVREDAKEILFSRSVAEEVEYVRRRGRG